MSLPVPLSYGFDSLSGIVARPSTLLLEPINARHQIANRARHPTCWNNSKSRSHAQGGRCPTRACQKIPRDTARESQVIIFAVSRIATKKKTVSVIVAYCPPPFIESSTSSNQKDVALISCKLSRVHEKHRSA